MRPNKYSEAKKRWFALAQAEDLNHKAQRALGWIELDKPIFKGWEAYLILREDISNREDAWIYEFITKNFSAKIYSKRKDFKRKNYKTKKWEVINPAIYNITKDEYNRLASQIKKLFDLDTNPKHMEHGEYTYRCNVPNFYFVVKKKKYYQTKVREHDEVLLQEEAEIKAQMKADPLFRKLDVYYYGDIWTAPQWYRRDRNRSEKMKHKKALHKFLRNGEDYGVSSNFRDASWYF